MSVEPFQPVDGVKARWRHCYDLAIEREPRQQITVHEVMELLDCDERAAWAAMDQARYHMELDGHRSLVTVPRFGWIVATASDMLRIGDQRRKKAIRQVGRGMNVLAAAPRGEMSQFEREAADRQLAAFTALSSLQQRRMRLPLSAIGAAGQ